MKATDVAGVAEFERLDLGEKLIGESADGARLGLTTVAPLGHGPLELVVRPEAAREFEIVDASGKPVVGAWATMQAGRLPDANDHGFALSGDQIIAWRVRVMLRGRVDISAGDRFALAALANLNVAAWDDRSLRLALPTGECIDAGAMRLPGGVTRIELP